MIDYPLVEAWYVTLGSNGSWISDRLKQAKQEKAPFTATHKNVDGTWSTIEDCHSPATLRVICDYVYTRPDNEQALEAIDKQMTVVGQEQMDIIAKRASRENLLAWAEQLETETERRCIIEKLRAAAEIT